VPVPGFDTFVVDDPNTGVAATATDTLYLLSASAAAPATPTVKKKPDTGDDTLDAQLRAYFALGGTSVYLQGYGDGTPLPLLADAVAQLPAGPGQVVAPEAVTSADLISVAGAWQRGKVALLQPASTATDAQVETLAAAIIAGTDARGAGLFDDYILMPSLTGGTDLIPLSLIVAGLAARNDRLFKNPNLAAAGVQGRIDGALGINDPKDDTRRAALRDAQVNTAKDVWGSLRNYGFRTLADLDVIPHWWDLSGSRTVMAYRAKAAAIDEDFVFGQIDGQGSMLARYEGRLRAAAKELYDAGALFGATPDEAYRVDVGESVNPTEELAAGEVKAQVYLKTSPFAEHLVTNITRRAITATV
jgi:hypothetical protein